MKNFRKWAAVTLLMTLPVASLKGQNSCVQDDCCYSSAYAQSSQAAHWSAYVPIGIMVAAAIWFAVADQNHEKNKDSYYCNSKKQSNRRCSHSYSSSSSCAHY